MAHSNLGGKYDLHVEGRAKFVLFLSESPRILHLRSFTDLSTKILLRLQGQLAWKEKDILKLEKDSARTSRPDGGQGNLPDQTILNEQMDELEIMMRKYRRWLSTQCIDNLLTLIRKVSSSTWPYRR